MGWSLRFLVILSFQWADPILPNLLNPEQNRRLPFSAFQDLALHRNVN